MARTIIEPFRIKMVEPLPRTTRQQRERFLAAAHYNVFQLRSNQVTIDLLTDSGTGAMSAAQWAAMMTGDETYAGSESFFRLEEVVRELSGMRHVIPTHQGRAAEHILFNVMSAGAGVVVANSHFDTTRANVEHFGGRAVDLPVASALDPSSEFPFKGNMDLERLERLLSAQTRTGDLVVMVIMTVTNNGVGGHPASLENLRAVSRLARRYSVPFFLDAARFAENAWFIKQREPGQGERTPRDIAREIFRLADGFVMSGKKDGLVNIGGLLCLNDDEFAARARNLLMLTEGFPTYGGLAGRDLAALAVGLQEVLEESYLEYRAASVRYLYDALDRECVPLVRPAGGHGVYIDAGAMYPHVPPHELPGVALINELYLEGGVRAVEIGTLMFGRTRAGIADVCAPLELVRLTVPRRVYTQSHVDYLAEIVASVYWRRAKARGYRISRQASALRAFTAQLTPLGKLNMDGDASQSCCGCCTNEEFPGLDAPGRTFRKRPQGFPA